MADPKEPEDESRKGASENEDKDADPNLFGIDLGRRGDREDQKSRDEVDAPVPKKVRAVIRTLTERLASAAADRNHAAQKPKDDDAEKDD
jgi:hypothetical protein